MTPLDLALLRQMASEVIPPEPMVKKLTVHADDRGSLFEVLHDYELPSEKVVGESDIPAFGQVYIVRSPVRGTIRGFHRHVRLWDYFTVVHGRAKVIVVRREYGESKVTNDMVWSTVLAAEAPSMVVIPPYLYHGWESGTDETVLVSIASEVYDGKKPDEERIPFDAFGDVWGIKPK
jgi:dTDP-4-dehydrorhamnose 3,5-epimerase-like enzyme